MAGEDEDGVSSGESDGIYIHEGGVPGREIDMYESHQHETPRITPPPCHKRGEPRPNPHALRVVVCSSMYPRTLNSSPVRLPPHLFLPLCASNSPKDTPCSAVWGGGVGSAACKVVSAAYRAGVALPSLAAW